jgi:hypothetical protein
MLSKSQKRLGKFATRHPRPGLWGDRVHSTGHGTEASRLPIHLYLFDFLSQNLLSVQPMFPRHISTQEHLLVLEHETNLDYISLHHGTHCSSKYIQ